MRQTRTPLRGSVTQSTARVREQDGVGFLARLGLLAGLLLVFLIVAVVSWRYGWPQHEVQKLQKGALDLTQKAHFEIKRIDLVGRLQSTNDEIYAALLVKRGDPILSIDIKEAAARLGKLPWVDSARVERRLPDTIAVVLTERAPMAIWQNNDKFFIIDDQGHVLPSAKPEDFPLLPQVVGPGAEREAHALLVLLNNYPDIREKMDSAVRVGERRWDLYLAHKITVKLPETDVDAALHGLSVLIAEKNILDRPIVAVDLRIPDRLVLEPAEEAKPTGETHP
jgi:cell division protein FtsQ